MPKGGERAVAARCGTVSEDRANPAVLASRPL